MSDVNNEKKQASSIAPIKKGRPNHELGIQHNVMARRMYLYRYIVHGFSPA